VFLTGPDFKLVFYAGVVPTPRFIFNAATID